MMRPLILLVAAAIWAVPVGAREVTAEDREAVASLIERVDAATEAGDMLAALDVVPPALLDALAEASGLSREEIREAMEAALAEVMVEVEIVSFEIHLDRAGEAETSAGRPYLLAPTESVMRVGDQTFRSESATLALEDGGEWYLVRAEDVTQIAMLQEVYPDFAGIEFPRGRMSVVE